MVRVLDLANTALLFSSLALLATVMLAYPFAQHFSLPVQISAHIGTLVFATGIKLAYVTRLVALRALGRPVH